MTNGYLFYYNNVISLFTNRSFKGWGRKRTGQFALWCYKNFGGDLTLVEDGFIRSIGLGVDGAPSFSTVEDDIGIYYDATQPSRLENILNTYNFSTDVNLMQTAKEAMELIRKHHITKFNNASDMNEDFFKNDSKFKVLIIAQTAGDTSLEYGLAGETSTRQMIEDALKENPNASVYIKIHPDVLSGKKSSDIKPSEISSRCILIDEEINPISLLKHFDKIYTKTSGMGMEALILGKEVVCYGVPYYAGWGLTEDQQPCRRRTRKLSIEEVFAGAYILYPRYYNPYSQKESDIIDTIRSIIKYRNIYRQNEGELYFFGFSKWKRRFVIPFFSTFKKNNIIFCSHLNDGLKKGLNSHSKIFIWGKKDFTEVENYAKEKNISLSRVEDGFVRSTSLGSDLTKAYSLAVDSTGIYFDPAQESDLEQILNTCTFDDALLERAKNLQQYLIENKISKYNIYQDRQLEFEGLREDQTVIMVPGQVEDDASIIYGADGMSNLELLQKTRENAPDAFIIYKPHPDVLVGNRKGKVEKNEALRYCDSIIEKASIDSVLERVDEVHTMTSLVGFEALMRGKKVTTYGLPFYAGWGLTVDEKVISRRVTKRTLEELIAAALILYPRYIDPQSKELCEIEVLLVHIDREKNRYYDDSLYRTLINGRNLISRKMQLILKVLLDK